MHSTLRFLLLLSAVCAGFCYRAPVSGGGSYTLPKIGNFPAPQPTFPRNHGLPDVYKHFRQFRSVDQQLAPVGDYQLNEEAAVEGQTDDFFRQPRSVDEYLEEGPAFVDDQTELTREIRSPYDIIFPTYRPPPTQPPKPIYV